MGNAKTCFLISPIGKKDSPERGYYDRVRNFLRYEVVEDYDLTRADEDVTASTITDLMIKKIIDSTLVIAFLDNENPNVYYEMAVRHAAEKVCFCIVSDKHQKERKNHRAFDIKDVPEIAFPYEEMMQYEYKGKDVALPKGLANFRGILKRAIDGFESGKQEVLNPIIRARRDFTLPEHETVSGLLDKSNKQLGQSLEKFQTEMMQKISAMNDALAENIVKSLNDVSKQAIATYIEGENEAFQALADETAKATYSLRTSRFAPQAISKSSGIEASNKAKEDFFNALCAFGERRGVICKRIMCMNATKKLDDLSQTITRTYGGSMELYLTKRSNNFELVVIDDIAAFLHFYDEQRRIKSTLLIRGRSVISEFEKVYDRIINDKDYDFHVIKCKNCKTLNDAAREYDEAVKLFPVEEMEN